MKMHLFILPSFKKNSGGASTVVSFPKDCVSSVSFVNTYADINSTDKTAPWYGVFLDNEYIDKAIKKNLKTFLMTIGNNALVLYKKNYLAKTADWYPRIFRSNIRLHAAPFRTEDAIEYEKILNGWVCEHGFK